MEKPKIALATMHGKERQIAPAFDQALGWEVVVADLDTDQFGSFDGEVPRTLTPAQAAVAKAKLGAKQLGLRYGLGNEGTIGHHPQFPLLTSDAELIAFVDTELGLQLITSHISPEIVAVRIELPDDPNLEKLAELSQLKDHAVNLVAEGGKDRILRKGITSLAELKTAVAEAQLPPGTKRILLESDFRAMYSPSRQKNITACAEKAAQRLAMLCPGCEYFGWGLVRYEYGLPCQSCGFENEHLARFGINGCVRCHKEESVELGRIYAEPASCLSCNP